MKALYSHGGQVPIARVLREYRAVVLPLAVVLGINLLVLALVVLPQTQRAASAEQRALGAERALQAAEADFKRAETLRVANSRATEDLARFYRDILPANVAAARRVLQLRLRQQADLHGVQYQGSGTNEEALRDSNLLRLTMSMRLQGSYDNIRSFIHEIETASDFVVIEQVSLSEAQQEEGLELLLNVSTYYRANPSAEKVSNNGR
jgi:Tfp pilus assembly protein PilO